MGRVPRYDWGDEASAVENQIITRAPLFESESGVIGASGQGKGDANEISTTALLCLMRGKAYEALENRERAVRWYKAAINADTRCVEALDRLVEKNMVSHEEQRQIVESLGQRAGFAWLKPMYKLKMQRNEETTRAVESVAEELAKSRGLGNNLDVLTACARQHYWKNRFRDAHKVTQRVVDADLHHHAVLPIHVCCLVELGLKTKLFFTAHHLVQAYPRSQCPGSPLRAITTSFRNTKRRGDFSTRRRRLTNISPPLGSDSAIHSPCKMRATRPWRPIAPPRADSAGPMSRFCAWEWST